MLVKSFRALLLCSFAVSGLPASEKQRNSYDMFPKAKEGQIRYIIEVPKEKNEDNYKIELFVGKEIMADCNTHIFLGDVEKESLEGWGYHYYVVDNIRGAVHTLRACSEPPVQRFVPVFYNNLLRYNSRLGTVVYVPKGYEVRYRIWHAEEKTHKAEQR